MNGLRRFFLWYALLTKRLLRKPAFLILLLCVPLLAGAMAAVAKQDSSIVSVALVCETDDPAALAAADRLLHSESLVRCTEYATEAAGRAAVASGKADAAWIFRDTASDEIMRFVSGRGTRGAVTVVEREDTVFLRLAREQLAAAMYPDVSKALFRVYLTERLGAPEDAPERYFDTYYNTKIATDPVIVFSDADGGESADGPGYLVTPVRGLLALLLVLTGLASAMYYDAEERRETFLRLPPLRRRLLPLLYHLTALLPMALAVLLALWAAGLLGAPARELGLMALYCLSAAAFSELARKLCRTQGRLGAALPVLMALMLALCPVFLDIKQLTVVRHLLPPFYYLNAICNSAFLWPFALFTIAAAAVAAAIPGTNERR
jgi:ABC-2 type transport system permease protein